MRTYGQYCPIARTSELFAERWTPIIIRNLLTGCRTFGDLLAGAPGISKALLAQRLELLEAHGILIKETNSSGRGFVYSLTEQGRELKAITDAMGSWGARWLELQPHHIDPAYVLWATCKLVDLKGVPSKSLVARIDLADRPKERFWMLIKRSHAEVCSTYPHGSDGSLSCDGRLTPGTKLFPATNSGIHVWSPARLNACSISAHLVTLSQVPTNSGSGEGVSLGLAPDAAPPSSEALSEPQAASTIASERSNATAKVNFLLNAFLRPIRSPAFS
jgi:DNA-binding HxlR family transcriptional regulator